MYWSGASQDKRQLRGRKSIQNSKALQKEVVMASYAHSKSRLNAESSLRPNHTLEKKLPSSLPFLSNQEINVTTDKIGP